MKNRTCNDLPGSFEVPQELEDDRLLRVQGLETARENMHKTPRVFYSKSTKKRSAMHQEDSSKKTSQKKRVTREKTVRKSQTTMSESDADVDDDELKKRDRPHVRNNRYESVDDDTS